MSALLWLALSLAAAGGAWLIAWPALRGHRSREARDLNAERYLAWRGRARPTTTGSKREGMTADERRRIAIGAILAAVALVALVAFFLAS